MRNEGKGEGGKEMDGWMERKRGKGVIGWEGKWDDGRKGCMVGRRERGKEGWMDV